MPTSMSIYKIHEKTLFIYFMQRNPAKMPDGSNDIF